MKRFFFVISWLVILSLCVSVLWARPPRPPKPGPHHRWVNSHWIYLPAPANTIWVTGYYDHNGNWRPGHFQFTGNVPAGQVWVPGHWEGDSWVPGHFRQNYRKDFIWVTGHPGSDGKWAMGYWKFTGPPKKGHLWVNGHWQSGRWVKGFWRPMKKPGRNWAQGHYGPRGKWVPGRWKKK